MRWIVRGPRFPKETNIWRANTRDKLLLAKGFTRPKQGCHDWNPREPGSSQFLTSSNVTRQLSLVPAGTVSQAVSTLGLHRNRV